MGHVDDDLLRVQPLDHLVSVVAEAGVAGLGRPVPDQIPAVEEISPIEHH
jgi:hypothetical protein